MYVCICKKITEKMVQEYASKGITGTEMLKRLGLGSDCGICVLDKIENQLKTEKSKDKS